MRTAACALVVHEPIRETRRTLNGRTIVSFEQVESTVFASYPVGPTEPWKTPAEARADFLEGLLEEAAGAGR